MKRIEYTDTANDDLKNLAYAITHEYKSPVTAFHYVQGIKDEIKLLKRSPESYPVQTRRSLLQYGSNVRRINYKKMAIIYTVHGDIVYIHRIIPASMITGL